MYYQQAQVDKLKVEQKVDLEYNIDFMGRALSKAEIYAFRFGDPNKTKNMQPLFGFYNRFNSGYEKNQIELFKSLVNAVKFVDYGLEETEAKFNEILFPNNMPLENVLDYIKNLSLCLDDPQEKRIYNDLIKVLKRTNSDFNKYNNLYDKNAKMDPKLMMEAYPHMNKAIGKKEKKWKDKAESNPNYQPGFQLGKNFEDDEDFQDYNMSRGRKGYGNK